MAMGVRGRPAAWHTTDRAQGSRASPAAVSRCRQHKSVALAPWHQGELRLDARVASVRWLQQRHVLSARAPRRAAQRRRGLNLAAAASGRDGGEEKDSGGVAGAPSLATSGPPVQTQPLARNAAEAVNSGLELYKKGKIREALKQFDLALDLKPNKEEAQAALYNKACCHAYMEEGKKAQEALREALKDYDLRFSVILSDPDMAPFRAMKEFRELQEEARRGGEEVGSNFRRDLKLISEAQSPFRGVRKFLYVALIMAAGIASFFTVPRLILAARGGDGAPELLPTLGNLAINLGGGAGLVWLFLWDQRKEEEQIVRVSRDETLSRLPLRLQSGRVVELVQLRESTRPIILAGKKESVQRAMKKAEGYRKQLLDRGVLIIPLVQGSGNAAAESAAAAKRKGFAGAAEKKPKGNPFETLEEFEERARAAAAKRVSEAERRFKAEPVSPGEWDQWVQEQQASEGIKSGDDVYILLRLDGRVRQSGKGMPDWAEIITETPELDSLVSKLER